MEKAVCDSSSPSLTQEVTGDMSAPCEVHNHFFVFQRSLLWYMKYAHDRWVDQRVKETEIWYNLPGKQLLHKNLNISVCRDKRSFHTRCLSNILTLNSGTACKGCSPIQTRSLPLPQSMVLCLVMLASSMSTSNTPTPGVITMESLPVRSIHRSKYHFSNT